MKVLIVGGMSALGSALKTLLLPKYEVITAGRRGCDVELDLTWPPERFSLPEGVDTVVHTAAHFGGTSAADILEAECVNVLGTMKLCDAAARANAGHFVLISSVFALLDPQSPLYGAYALSKRHSEDVARFVCGTHRMPLAVLRPSQIYGAGPRFRMHQPFLHTMLEKARAGEDIVLYGTHDPRRNFIYIDDLTKVIERVAAARVVGSWCCQYPVDVTYAQIAAAAFRAFGTTGSVRFLPEKPDIPDNVVAIDRTLYDTIDFQPGITVDDGLRRMASVS